MRLRFMVEIKGPIKGYYYPHKAIRVELESLEKKSVTLDSESTAELEEFKHRLDFLKMFFNAHEDGEEASLYPAAGNLRKDLNKAFEWDRHISEECFKMIFEAIDEYRKSRARSASLKIVRGMAALGTFLGAHETKEDEILLPLIDRELDPKAQGEVIGKAMSKFPPSTVEDVEKFLIKRLTQNDRVDFLRIVKQGAPLETFKAITKWVKEVLSEEEWKELKIKMPELQ
jgi:hemerythrin-like domain-containing protein